MKDKKLFEATETKIISVQAESVIVTSITNNGKDGDDDKATGWKNFSSES